jgi:AcrR family transcriptional regulator
MARPRAFDEEIVLDRALHAFWQHGFEGTSIADLEQATGLVRTSLYAAFGDKEQLFGKVLARFQGRYDAFIRDLLEGEPVRAGFEVGFQRWLGLNCQGAGPRGCLVQLAVATGGADLPQVQAILKESTVAMQRAVGSALLRARERGELVNPGEIEALTGYVLVSIQGLSSAARAGSSRAELESVIRVVLDSLFGVSAAEPTASAADCH